MQSAPKCQIIVRLAGWGHDWGITVALAMWEGIIPFLLTHPLLVRTKIIRTKQYKSRSQTISRAALLLRGPIHELGQIRDNCHGNWTRPYTLTSSSGQSGIVRPLTVRGILGRSRSAGATSFMNSSVRSWCSSGAALVLIKAPPK